MGEPGRRPGRHRVGILAGYRGVRPLEEADLPRLRLFAGAHAACSLVRIAGALDASGDDDPEWMTELRAKLTALARSHRELAITVAESL